MEFENWTTFELVDYLVDNEIYDDIETALMSSRSDLICECNDTLEED
jgi:hypothetical protein